MSFWAGIKHALNSTLGTSNFKPLDTIIKEQINGIADELTGGQTGVVHDINELIVGQTRMVASDTLYSALEGVTVELPTVNVAASKELPQKIRMTRSGTVRFKGELYRNPATKIKGTFFIYKNGAEVFNFSKAADYGANTEVFSADVTFVPGDVFSFKVTGTNTQSATNTRTVAITNFTMNGDIEHNIYEIV